MDLLFKALDGPHRRRILDLLHERDGRTTTEIEEQFPEMTRFGVAKHLNVLEKASLVTTRREGRFKYHYLNTVPLQEMADRWIARLRAPWAMTLADLKIKLEREQEMTTAEVMTTNLKHIYVTIIKTTPEKLWQALTDPALTPAYYYGATIASDLKPGSDFHYMTPDQRVMVGGKVIEAIPPKRLVTTFTGDWMPEMRGDAPSRVTYEIEPLGECCRLTLTHDGFASRTKTYDVVANGWPGILSGLKTLLETGQPLMYNPMAG